MKTKLLALLLLAGSSMFAATRFSFSVGGGYPYYYTPPPVYYYQPYPAYTYSYPVYTYSYPRYVYRSYYYPRSYYGGSVYIGNRGRVRARWRR